MNTNLGTHSSRHDLALAIVRVVVGIVFIAHGAQKLFVMGLGNVGEAFGQMGVPLSGATGPFISVLEFAGGIALVLGVLTRPIALLLAVDMLGAIVLVHLPAGFFLPNGYEFALTLLGATAALALAGAGRYSVDAMLADRRTRGSVEDRPRESARQVV